jgi:hypothetical protein
MLYNYYFQPYQNYTFLTTNASLLHMLADKVYRIASDSFTFMKHDRFLNILKKSHFNYQAMVYEIMIN